MEWQLVLVLVIVVPVALFMPILIWAVAASGLYDVVRYTLRRRVMALRRRTVRMAGEAITREVA